MGTQNSKFVFDILSVYSNCQSWQKLAFFGLLHKQQKEDQFSSNFEILQFKLYLDYNGVGFFFEKHFLILLMTNTDQKNFRSKLNYQKITLTGM